MVILGWCGVRKQTYMKGINITITGKEQPAHIQTSIFIRAPQFLHPIADASLFPSSWPSRPYQVQCQLTIPASKEGKLYPILGR